MGTAGGSDTFVGVLGGASTAIDIPFGTNPVLTRVGVERMDADVTVYPTDVLTGEHVVGTGNLIGVPGGSVGNVVKANAFDRRNASNRGVSFRWILIPGVFATGGMRVTGAVMVTVFPIALTPPKGGKVDPVVLLVGVGGGTIDGWNTGLQCFKPARLFVVSSFAVVVGVSVGPVGPPKTTLPYKYLQCRYTALGVVEDDGTLLVDGTDIAFIVRVSGKHVSFPITSCSADLPSCLLPTKTVRGPSWLPPFSSEHRSEGTYRPIMRLYAVANGKVMA